jgi:hypothetical protein
VNQPHVIVWDLDRTLGDFVSLHGQGEAAYPIHVKMRPGLREALEALDKAGFVHTLLTLASPLYAEVVLRGTGLRPFFARVEGLGQRNKGDAAGIGEFGLAARERPHRMLFVGDHPLFDEPRDPQVVFHLETNALARPADELVRLVLHLREAGNGSLARGFERTRLGGTWWRYLWPWRWRPGADQTVSCAVEGVGRLLLLARTDGCPVVAFEGAPETAALPGTVSFVPAELVAQVEAERNKTIPGERGREPPVAGQHERTEQP